MIFTTGADRRATLTIVRSLGRKGLKVCVGNHKHNGTAFLSRYCSEKFIYPNPQHAPKDYFTSIIEKIKERKFNVIMPVHDFELFPLLMKKDKIEKHCIIPFVDFETFMKTVNKTDTIKIAKKLGVRAPETIIPESRKDLVKIAREIGYPIVIKPVSQTIWSFDKTIKTRYVTEKNYVNNKHELMDFFKDVKDPSEYLLQEYVKGKGAGTAYLFNKGKQRASFVYKRVREYPITGGPSTLRVSIDHRAMLEMGKKLLEHLGWHGVAMVEYKLNEHGKPVLMEINGRFWGSVALAYRSGVDFPYLLYKMAVDGDVKVQDQHKSGVLCRWLIPGDIMNFYFSLKANRDDNLKSFRDFFKFRGMYYDYIDKDDLLPVFGAFMTSAGNLRDFLRRKRSIYGEYR
jgi:predicted ATP-grasp superfamily ATP-dependent carboligase